ncbi:MAG: DUF1837 domain-containing protein [Candidatus Omnitrophica bacterium]|nr:DUF1837 domain-containing protein [Candidatus Omnitrophota bacterium]
MCRIEKALDNLLIKTKSEIKSRVECVSFDVEIQDTKSRGYCYCLKREANGNLRLEDLIDYIDEKLVDYAIPKKEKEEALSHFQETGSTSKIIRLKKKAQQLFTDLKKTGEGGEILLYILIEEFLKIPQLLSKMTLKTSPQMHYHGADGIYVQYDKKSAHLHLYWGESKMYQDINAGISKCLDSIKDFLLDPMSASSVQERDIQLITSNIKDNVNHPELEDMLVRYFDKDDDLSNKVVYKGICFIGFDWDSYPTVEMEATIEDIKDKIIIELEEWYSKVSKKIIARGNLALKEMHIFLMPFSSVEKFREYYLKTIK